MAESNQQFEWVKSHEAIESLRDEARHLGDFLELQRLRQYLSPREVNSNHAESADSNGHASASG